jgi:hypothetical protein
MKRILIYTILKVLSLLLALACAWLFVGPILAMMLGKSLHGSGWVRWIGSVFGLLILTVILYVLGDIGTRLIRVEETQELILRDMPKETGEHKG